MGFWGLMEVATQAMEVIAVHNARCPSTYHWFMKVAAQAMEVIAVHDARCPSAFHGFLGGF
jgi:hypothetical protein